MQFSEFFLESLHVVGLDQYVIVIGKDAPCVQMNIVAIAELDQIGFERRHPRRVLADHRLVLVTRCGHKETVRSDVFEGWRLVPGTFLDLSLFEGTPTLGVRHFSPFVHLL